MARKNVGKKARKDKWCGVQYACKRGKLPDKAYIRAWVAVALEVNGRRAGQITVRIVKAGEGRQLNRRYRGKPYATNVLSFPYALEPRVSGDLVLCAPVVAREAAAQGKSLEAHYAHLIVHGLLHLQGYDHELGAAQAAEMENLERRILAILAYPDPYPSEG
ncbi:MAG TPA: rRNA maturation RNase YbeY [Accumulibacter sp.]|mgnify:CR=1 FL=1|jgi:probable rRNA maturation factor|nr:rRNA maturation RNase YbeY [Accumulibacter sp.]HQC79187.1 rRNA maturation RNase YbeY [Accumulibacter sp.]